MKKVLTTLLILFSMYDGLACSCECNGDCSFSKISNNAEFVALVKILAYEDFLKYNIPGHEGKMPESMVVEVVKKYKGKEERSKLKIWGDNGVLCRPYISEFEIGEYFLIAPRKTLEDKERGVSSEDYTF